MSRSTAPQQPQQPHESTPLLPHPHDNGENHPHLRPRQHSHTYDADVESLLSSALSKPERALHSTPLGERLPYNGYITIDWLHGLVTDSLRRRALRARTSPFPSYSHSHSHSRSRLRYLLTVLGARLACAWDAAQGWVVAALVGLLTALVAAGVDVAVATVADWKEGFCGAAMSGGGGWGWWFLDRRSCGEQNWMHWGAGSWGGRYAVYVGVALVYGVIAGGVTLTTRTELPVVEDDRSGDDGDDGGDEFAVSGDDGINPRPRPAAAEAKIMYMAAGSGIPEIKTILSGFVIPRFLSMRVLAVKAVGATFAVATGMCLGKEGPFVHISSCVGWLVASRFQKYRENERKMREMLSVACSSGLSVAFGAPIGGVLFSYEEISTFFPRRVMWKAFLCSLVAAVSLKQLNPMGTGKLVLFETNYGVDYEPLHYIVFVFLGLCGGVFGGIFCQANFLWAKLFRQRFAIINNHPVLEVSLVVLATALVQFPNRLVRSTGDVVVAELLVDCRTERPQASSWICRQEARDDKGAYMAWLATGTLTKLVLTIITFGCKVPSGIIIPALDAGALFGRLTAQVLLLMGLGGSLGDVSPGIFAMVGSAAFLAGVSRMTVSLAVIMFELTGEVNFVPPFMVAILTSKWVADSISAESVYDLAQHLLGHPFLDAEHALAVVADAQIPHDSDDDEDGDDANGGGTARKRKGTIEDLIPPRATMEEITLHTGPNFRATKATLRTKLARLKSRGLMDAGLVLVNDKGICHGYLPEAELEFALDALDKLKQQDRSSGDDATAQGHDDDDDNDEEEVNLVEGLVAEFVDRCPLTVMSKAPVEYAVEMFGKLGLRYLIVVEEETANVLGVVIKKRLVSYLDALRGR